MSKKRIIEVGIRFGTVEDAIASMKKKQGRIEAKLIPSIFSEERIRLLKEIKKGNYTVTELSREVGRKIENVSRDLAYLKKQGIITFEKKGREKIPIIINYGLTIDI